MRRTLPILLSLTAGLWACNDGMAEDVAVVSGPILGAPIDAPASARADGSSAPRKPAPEVKRSGASSGEAQPASPGTDAPSAATPKAPTGANPEHGVKSSGPTDLAEGEVFLTFEDLAWPEYQPPELRDLDEETIELSDFPEHLQELHGAQARMDGYMVPVDFEDKKVTSFILSRYLPGCCFGVMPLLDEWVEIEVVIEGGVDYFPYQIVRVSGEFEVGELLDDYGYVRSIFRMKAEKVEEQF